MRHHHDATPVSYTHLHFSQKITQKCNSPTFERESRTFSFHINPEQKKKSNITLLLPVSLASSRDKMCIRDSLHPFYCNNHVCIFIQ